MSEWKFADPPNVAVLVERKIASGEDWIAHVSHDEEDGMWQFHSNSQQAISESDAMLVSLRNVTQIDSTVIALADLPTGWRAWRDSRDSEWQRFKI